MRSIAVAVCLFLPAIACADDAKKIQSKVTSGLPHKPQARVVKRTNQAVQREAQRKKRTDKGKGAVIDRVLEYVLTNTGRAWAVGEIRWIPQQRPQGATSGMPSA